MDVATYCRISTDEERQPFSLDAQTERLAAYIAAQPEWRHVRSYTDQISGKSLDRPGLQQSLTDARRGRYELLLVFKVDRLARSTGGLARVLGELDSTGVAFRSASEPFDTSTAAGRMMVQMLGVFAEFEREMIVERTKMGLAKKAAAASGPVASLPTAITTTRTSESSFRTSKKRPTSAGSSSSTWNTSWEPPRSATG